MTYQKTKKKSWSKKINETKMGKNIGWVFETQERKKKKACNYRRWTACDIPKNKKLVGKK